MSISAIISVGTIAISVVALVLSAIGFCWNRKVWMLNADNNIIQYVSALLTFLERAKNLDEKEREIFKKLLCDAKFFGPTNKEILHDLAVARWSVDKDLEQYFRSI